MKSKHRLWLLLLLCDNNQSTHFKPITHSNSTTTAKNRLTGLPPIMTDMFMHHLQTQYINLIKKEFILLHYKRKVDGTVLAFKNKSNIDPFLTNPNNRYPNLKFTVETDIMMKECGNNNSTSIFRKPSSTELYIHWTSRAPFGQKVNLITWKLSMENKEFFLEFC